VDLLDPAGDQLLPDRLGVGRGQEVVDGVVRRGGEPLEDCVGVVVTGLNALEIQDRQPAEPAELRREPDVDDRVHRRREDWDCEREPGERAADVDVGRLDRLGARG
jgi:hypothetical protein